MFTVSYTDEHELTAWTFTTVTDAERMFVRLQQRALRSSGDVRIHLGYTHVDCEEPQRHSYEN